MITWQPGLRSSDFGSHPEINLREQKLKDESLIYAVKL